MERETRPEKEKNYSRRLLLKILLKKEKCKKLDGSIFSELNI